jgi:hypothetical protein
MPIRYIVLFQLVTIKFGSKSQTLGNTLTGKVLETGKQILMNIQQPWLDKSLIAKLR